MFALTFLSWFSPDWACDLDVPRESTMYRVASTCPAVTDASAPTDTGGVSTMIRS